MSLPRASVRSPAVVMPNKRDSCHARGPRSMASQSDLVGWTSTSSKTQNVGLRPCARPASARTDFVGRAGGLDHQRVSVRCNDLRQTRVHSDHLLGHLEDNCALLTVTGNGVDLPPIPPTSASSAKPALNDKCRSYVERQRAPFCTAMCRLAWSLAGPLRRSFATVVAG